MSGLSLSGCSITLFEDDILLNREIKVPEDYMHVHFVVDDMTNCLSNNYLCLNTAKCKYKISHKRNRNIPVGNLC